MSFWRPYFSSIKKNFRTQWTVLFPFSIQAGVNILQEKVKNAHGGKNFAQAKFE